MNTEVIKEIANQLGIAASAVTQDVIPAYASYVIANGISRFIFLGAIAIGFVMVARVCFMNYKKFADSDEEKSEIFQITGYVLVGFAAFLAMIALADIVHVVPWVVSPYGAFVSLLVS